MDPKPISLSLGNNTLVINPVGARILQLTLHGTHLLTEVKRGDGKTASTHPCTPIFGPETDTNYGLVQHGNMRNAACEVSNHTETSVTLRHTIDEGSYPKGMVVTQCFTIGQGICTIETTHENTGDLPAPVTFCEHFYWHAPNGWEGVLVNGKDVTAVVKADDVIPLVAENLIEIPGQPAFNITQEGLPLANLWAMQHADNTAYDSSYVCIEPCEGKSRSPIFGSEPSIIQPKMKRTTVIKIIANR